MNKKLTSSNFGGVQGPLLLIVMDGIGYGTGVGDAVASASTPTLDMLMDKYPTAKLKAHGTAVGLPGDDDMGNSEVGHNALGAGQVFAQGAKLVTASIDSGNMYASDTWKELTAPCKNGGTLHFIGLFSDGNVHSHIDHLHDMLIQAKKDGVKRVRLHILTDGRDVREFSADEYVRNFEASIAELWDSEEFDVRIASGGGRMKLTMDRYEADWGMVELGWRTHVLGEGRQFACAEDAIATYRKEIDGLSDQNIPPFVIAEDGKPVGTIEDGDSVIFYNFRGDRAIEISRAFEETNFDKFDRVRFPKVLYAGMLEYDGDLHIPSRYLVSPPAITNTMSEYLAATGVAQAAISETQKYGHVTYFWNGNKSGKFSEELETYVEIPSDTTPFEHRPWMKCADITDKLIEMLESRKYKFLRVNYPNGDMVGHTGDFGATELSVQALDLQLARLLPVIDRLNGAAIITADHGNAEEMCEVDKKTKAPKVNADGKAVPKTSHSLNKVPFIIYDNHNSGKYALKDGDFGLSNVAATVVNLLGYQAPDMWDESMVKGS